MIATYSTVSLAGETGYVMASEVPGGWCFVPTECVHIEGADLVVDEIAYLQSGWAVRNMRFNEVDAAGGRLYPQSGGPVIDPELPAVAEFLARIRNARSGVARRLHA